MKICGVIIMSYVKINGIEYLNVIDDPVWNSKRQILSEQRLNIPGVQTIGRTMSENNIAPLSPHVHKDCNEIVYVVSGSQQYSIKGENYVVHGNQLFIAPPSIPHSSGDKPHGRYDIYMIKLYSEYKSGFLGMSETYGKLLHSAIFSVKDLIISPAENLKHKFDKMFYHLSQNDLLDNLQGKIILQELLLDICMSIKEENKAVSPTVSSAINYIATNITEEISLEDLAMYSGLSLSRFKQRFRDEMGISPREYVNVKKVEKAKELLASGKNITDTAFELSFSSSNYFSVVFKKVTGMSPKEYLKNKLKE